MSRTSSFASGIHGLIAGRDEPRRSLRRRCAAQADAIESLELRELLAGVVAQQSTFDFELFGENIEEQAGEEQVLQVEGYSYSASLRDPDDPFEGVETISGGAGLARQPWDNANGVGSPASALRRQEIASITKTITATGVLNALQELTDSIGELSTRLDDPIIDYLPDSWGSTSSPAFDGITVRQLLTHTSGLRASAAATPTTPAFPGTVGGIPGGFTNSGYVYSDLQSVTQSGTVFSNASSYWTINYAFFRVALPYMWAEAEDVGLGPTEPTFRDQLEAADNGQFINIDALPLGVWNQIQEDFGYTPADLIFGNRLLLGPDELTASAYKTYIIRNVLPEGVPLPTQTGPTPTLLYQFPAPNGVAGRNTGNQTLLAGSRGMNLSANHVREIFTWLRYSDTVLNDETRSLMESEFLGFRPNFSGVLGTYYGHDGINFSAQVPGAAPNTNAPRNNTIAMSFPNGVEGTMLMSSQLGSAFGAAFDPNAGANSPARSIMDAYDNAWTHITYAGDPSSDSSDGNDVFTLRADDVAPDNWIELDLNGTVVMERRIDTLHSLTLLGYSGDDSLIIQDLPNGMELDIVFDGSSGDDSITIGTLGENVSLTVDFLGTSGEDTATVNALADDVELDFTFEGGVSGDTLTLNNLSDSGSLNIHYEGGSGEDSVGINTLSPTAPLDLVFNGGSSGDSANINSLPASAEFTFSGQAGDDTLQVSGTTPGSIVTFNGGDNNDSATLGTGNLDSVRSTFLFVGGSGSDSLTANDRLNISQEQTHNGFDQEYIVRSTRIERSGIGIVGQFSQLENVRLDASNEKSLVRVLSSLGPTRLHLESHNGDDRIVLGSGNAGSQIETNIDVDTGSGNDELVVDDRFSQGGSETYVVQSKFFQSAEIPVVEWNEPPETIRLRQRRAASETNVRDVLDDVRLEVEGGEGDDHIYVHASQPESRMFLEGRGGDDVIILGEESSNVDPIRGEVRAFGGDHADRVVLRDRSGSGGDGRGYRFIDRFVDVVGSSFGQLVVPEEEGTELVEVQAGTDDDTFDVRTWMSAELHLHGSLGSDELVVAATAKTVDPILGEITFFADGILFPGVPSPDFDTVVIHDQKRAGSPDYDVDVGPDLAGLFSTTDFNLTHSGVEELDLKSNKKSNTINVFGQSSILHKADYVLNLGNGNDVVNVEAPVTATVHANGGGGKDRVVVEGTANADSATLLGHQLDVRVAGTLPTTTVIRDKKIQSLRFRADAGLDVVNFEGVDGQREKILVQATQTEGRGSITAKPFRPLVFEGLEDIHVEGNAGDDDRLRFAGTSQNDTFSVNPVGEGTTDQPFVQLTNNNAQQLLKLRDALDVGTPVVAGGSGDDTFRVTLLVNDAENPLRNVSLDGGKGKQDVLIVNHDNAEFALVEPAKSQKKGTLQFDNGTAILDILYRGFEELVGDLF